LSGISSILRNDEVRVTSGAEEIGAVICGIGGNGLCNHEVSPIPGKEIGYAPYIDGFEDIPAGSNVERLPTPGTQSVGVDFGK
jgi:hypothetical protein